MTILIEEIREKLPIQNIPAIIGETIYKVIHEVQEALHKNSDAIPTTLGVGSNGRIGLIMDAAVHDNISTMAYTRPTDPGPYVQHGPGDSAAAQSDANVMQK